MTPSPFAGRRRVLIDTSAYYELADSRRAQHVRARGVRDRLVAEEWRLFTTNFILAETHALLLTRLGRTIAARVLHDIDRSTATIVRVSAADERRAREIIDRYQDKDFSLTDAASFAVMERLRISAAFTFDRHFAQYGFAVLEAE